MNTPFSKLFNFYNCFKFLKLKKKIIYAICFEILFHNLKNEKKLQNFHENNYEFRTLKFERDSTLKVLNGTLFLIILM